MTVEMAAQHRELRRDWERPLSSQPSLPPEATITAPRCPFYATPA